MLLVCISALLKTRDVHSLGSRGLLFESLQFLTTSFVQRRIALLIVIGIWHFEHFGFLGLKIVQENTVFELFQFRCRMHWHNVIMWSILPDFHNALMLLWCIVKAINCTLLLLLWNMKRTDPEMLYCCHY